MRGGQDQGGRQEAYVKAKCHQKAIAKGIAVDAGCLAKAETKFQADIMKADTDGNCPGTPAGLEKLR